MTKLKTLARIIPTTIGIGLAAILVVPQLSTINLTQASINSVSRSPNSVSAIARLVTVRLLGKTVSGSGAIIQRQGENYLVITCAHVLQNAEMGNGFKILTSDGRSHQAERDYRFNFGNLDLAVVRFKSRNKYKVVKSGKSSNLTINSPAYVAGFPSYQPQENARWKDTSSLGINAYRYSSGEVALLLDRPMEKGYQLGLNNDIDSGMSGGPVLDRQGQLIGIIGRMGNVIDEPEAYLFADGTQPSEELLEQMISASWAIPITYVTQIINMSAMP